MIRARIPIHRHADGLWQAGPSTVQLAPERDVPVAAARPEENLEDLIETMMGEALLCLDKNGRRGTSESIEWEIVVDDVPYCYRCVQPMVEAAPDVERPEGGRWRCVTCGTSTSQH
jgi:hypothetical protein